MNQIPSKNTCLDYLWQYSRFYGQRLYECEELYSMGKGYAAIMLLFTCLENIMKSVANDYDSSFFLVAKKLKDTMIISNIECEFISDSEFSLRKIRNLFAHNNLLAINLLIIEDEREILYPLTEEESCLRLYNNVSDIVFNLMLKIVSSNFIDEVKIKFKINLSKNIEECKIKFKTLSIKELMSQKGLPEDYFPDDIEAPECENIRLIDNSSDVNTLSLILGNLTDILNNNA